MQPPIRTASLNNLHEDERDDDLSFLHKTNNCIRRIQLVFWWYNASFVPRIQYSQVYSCACSDTAIDEQVNAGCTTRGFAQACWPLRGFSDQCQDIRLGDGEIFFSGLTLFLLHVFLYGEAPQEGKYCVIAELTAVGFIVYHATG